VKLGTIPVVEHVTIHHHTTVVARPVHIEPTKRNNHTSGHLEPTCRTERDLLSIIKVPEHRSLEIRWKLKVPIPIIILYFPQTLEHHFSLESAIGIVGRHIDQNGFVFETGIQFQDTQVLQLCVVEEEDLDASPIYCLPSHSFGGRLDDTIRFQ
jgi:hypothetical protein